jgi:hypothetical protein
VQIVHLARLQAEPSPWWQLDLPSALLVTAVEVWPARCAPSQLPRPFAVDQIVVPYRIAGFRFVALNIDRRGIKFFQSYPSQDIASLDLPRPLLLFKTHQLGFVSGTAESPPATLMLDHARD